MKLLADRANGLDPKDDEKLADGINARLIVVLIFLTSFSLYLNTLANGFVTLPLILLAYDGIFRRSELRLREWVKIHLPYWIVAGIYLMIRINALGGFAPVNTGIGLTPYECFLGILVLFSQYLEKLLFPVNLNVYHVFRP